MLAQAFSKTFSRFSLLFILATFLLPLVVGAQVNINTADLETLDTLPGVGPTIAQRIIDYRSANGPFGNIEELKNVTGIGDVVFSNLKDFVTVGSTNTETNTPLTQTATSTQTTTSSKSSSSGVTSGSSSLPATATISGSNRVGVVGSPIEFRVEGRVSGGQNIFKWNFGDGAQGSGSVVSHVYDYPGDYTVVLSLSASQDKVADRVNVRIIEPEVSITLANTDRIELYNPSNQEISLFGRAIFVGGKVFMFPKDTIVRPGAKISFAYKITGLSPNHLGEVEWVVMGENRDVHKIGRIVEERREEREERINVIKSEIGELEQRLAVARVNSAPARSITKNAPSVAVVEMSEEVEESSESNLASAITSIESDDGSGWWERMKRFFLRTQ